MKKVYAKPTVKMMHLQPEEKLACCSGTVYPFIHQSTCKKVQNDTGQGKLCEPLLVNTY